MHFERGGKTDSAIHYLAVAARTAAGVNAHERAIALVERGLALLELLPADQERDRTKLELLGLQAPSLRATRGYTDTALHSVLDRTRRLAEELGDMPALANVLRSIWGEQFVAGDVRGALETGNRITALAKDLPELRAVGHHALAGALVHSGDLVGAIDHFERAREQHDPRVAKQLLSMFGSDLGVFNDAWGAHALWLYGLEDRAVATADEAVETARALEHAYSETLAHAYGTVLHYMRGDRALCAREADATRELCRRHGFAYYGHWGTILGSWARRDLDPSAAASAMRDALAALSREGSRARRPIYLAALAEALDAAGRRSEALAALDDADEYVRTSGDRMWSAELVRLRALWTPEQSLALARHALEIASAMRMRPLAVRCAVTLAEVMADDRRSAGAVVRNAVANLPDAGSSFDRGRAVRLLSALD
jgi:hypothetical protein